MRTVPGLMPRWGSSGGWGGEGLCFQTKTPRTEKPVSLFPSGPLGAESPWPSPLPSPSTGVSPTFRRPERWEMAQTSEEGNEYPHSSSWKEMPSSGEGEQRIWYGGSQGPTAHPRQGCAVPHWAPA